MGLAVLHGGKATVSQIADKLNVHPANLSRHVRILENAGLVELVERRDTGRNLEKYYTATALTFDVCPGADQLTSPHKTALSFARSQLSSALARLPDGDVGPVLVRLVTSRMSKKNMRLFLQELTKLSERFDNADGQQGDAYNLMVALYRGEDDGHESTQQPRIYL